MASSYVRTPEYRKKMSETIKKRWQDPSYRKKVSEAAKKRWQNPEHRKQMSERIKGFWEDPEYRYKHGHQSAEARARCAELQRQRWANKSEGQRNEWKRNLKRTHNTKKYCAMRRKMTLEQWKNCSVEERQAWLDRLAREGFANHPERRLKGETTRRRQRAKVNWAKTPEAKAKVKEEYHKQQDEYYKRVAALLAPYGVAPEKNMEIEYYESLLVFFGEV